MGTPLGPFENTSENPSEKPGSCPPVTVYSLHNIHTYIYIQFAVDNKVITRCSMIFVFNLAPSRLQKFRRGGGSKNAQHKMPKQNKCFII